MAYIIKGAGGAVAEPLSALGKSRDYGRQRDVYVLATRDRNRDCMRLWNDFAAEQPGMAQLIIKDVAQDRRTAAAANEELDRRLARAEKSVTKGRKPKKAKPWPVNKSHQAQLERAWSEGDALRAQLDSANPVTREMARAVLESRGR